jgi:hypothetical protein
MIRIESDDDEKRDFQDLKWDDNIEVNSSDIADITGMMFWCTRRIFVANFRCQIMCNGVGASHAAACSQQTSSGGS